MNPFNLDAQITGGDGIEGLEQVFCNCGHTWEVPGLHAYGLFHVDDERNLVCDECGEVCEI